MNFDRIEDPLKLKKNQFGQPCYAAQINYIFAADP